MQNSIYICKKKQKKKKSFLLLLLLPKLMSYVPASLSPISYVLAFHCPVSSPHTTPNPVAFPSPSSCPMSLPSSLPKPHCPTLLHLPSPYFCLLLTPTPSSFFLHLHHSQVLPLFPPQVPCPLSASLLPLSTPHLHDIISFLLPSPPVRSGVNATTRQIIQRRVLIPTCLSS